MEVAFALSSLAALCGCAPSSEQVELDRLSVPYVEDEPEARRLAAVEVRLIRRGHDAELALLLSAESAVVDPIPGFQGSRGTNRITARELGRIAREGRLEVVTTSREISSPAKIGSHRVVRTGRLPERTLSPDGRIDFEGRTAEEHALELAVDTGTLGVGRWRTELIVGGRSRLRVDHCFDGVVGRIENIDCHPVPVREELLP